MITPEYSGVRVFYLARQWEEGGKEKEGSTYKITKKSDVYSMIHAKELKKEFRVFGSKYKRVGEKVKPVDLGTGGDKPGGIPDWVQKSKEKDVYHKPSGTYSWWLIPKFSMINKGDRLTPERIEKLKIGASITPEEKDLLIEMLYNREKALAFDFSQLGRVSRDVAPPQVIKTIPHKAFQAPSFPIPKALIPLAIKMFKDRIDSGRLEPSEGPYRNP